MPPRLRKDSRRSNSVSVEFHFPGASHDTIAASVVMEVFVNRILSACILAGVIIFPICSETAKLKEAEKEENRDLPLKREKWFYHQRAYPHQRIPAGARLKAVQQMDSIDAAARARRQTFANAAPVNSPQAVSTSATWTSLGPQPTLCSSNYCAELFTNEVVPNFMNTSGRITALAVDPTNASVVYAAGAMGGVWKSTDAGSTWKALTDSQASLAMGSLAIDPQNHETIYAGTGEGNNAIDSYYGAGILKSTDGGATWANIMGPFVTATAAQRIGALAVSPGSSETVIAGADTGIYRSSDAGQTWKNVLGSTSGSAVVFDTSNPQTVYAAIGDPCGATCGVKGNGVYKSADGGATWTLKSGSGTSTFPTTGVGRIALAISPSTPSTLYALIQDGSQANSASPTFPLLGIWKSTDGADTWNKLSVPAADPTTSEPFCGFDGQCYYDLVIQVHPQNPNVVVAGGVPLALSTDGETFNYIPLQYAPNGNFAYAVHVDQHAIAFSADKTKVYFGNDGGVWSAPASQLLNGGVINFTNLNQQLALTQFYAGASVFPSGANSLLGGTQDNGTQLLAGSTWNNITAGDGGNTAVDATFPALLYGAFPPGSAPFSVWREFDLANEGPFANSGSYGIDASDSSEFIPPLTIDPVNPSTLYFGTYRVYQTRDSAGLWKAISPDLTGGSDFDDVTVITPSPADPNIVYAGTSNGKVQVTTNALSAAPAWSNRTPNLPNRYVTGIAADPRDPMTAYAALSGIPGFDDTQGHIFKTTNGAASWTDISGNLPNTPVNWLVVEPDALDTIYAATDVGVQVTTNGGTSWTSLGNGLPRVAVLSLTLDRSKRILYAGTHGRSMWSIALPLSSASLQPVISSLSPATVTAGGGAFTLTVSGSNFAQGTTLLWNGTSIPTTVVNAGQLTASVPSSDTSIGGRASLVAFNSTGGASPAVNFNIGPPPTAPAGGIISATGVVKGIAPGMIAALYGTNLAGTTAIPVAAPPLPVSLGQTTLLEDGETLPLFFVSPGQINFQVGWFQEPGTPTVFQVVNGAQVSSQSTYTVVPFAPSIFTVNQTGTGQGAIQFASGGMFAAPAGSIPGSSSRPAKPGEEVVIYCTGLGIVDAVENGILSDGGPAPSNPVANTLTIPTVTFGGVAGKVLFSGLAPGFVGLNQINVNVPTNAPTGNTVSVKITMVDTSVSPSKSYVSNTATMAIQ